VLEIALTLLIAGSPQAPAKPDTGRVAVRFPEGTAHGFLVMHAADGQEIARGDLMQHGTSTGVESVLAFDFHDGSRFEETVDYSQEHGLAMQRYHLIQRGAAFDRDLDATIWQSGRYQVRATSHRDGKVSGYTGSLDLPGDVANGLPLLIAKNLRPGETRTVHVVAFLPKPRVIGLEFVPSEPARVKSASLESTAHYTLKPKVGGITGVLAKLLGKIPSDSHIWIATTGAPAFLRFEGPMYSGPVWRIDLATPTWVH
jgi:hypothetical protein